MEPTKAVESPSDGPTGPDMAAVLAALQAQQAEIRDLRTEIQALRANAAVQSSAVATGNLSQGPNGMMRRVSRLRLLKAGVLGAAGAAAATVARPGHALAQAEPLLGELALFCGNFAPAGWALCNGQLLPISQNTALFSILGTTYGGDGKSTFALPDLRGRVPVHPGQGAGLSSYSLGQTGGSEQVTLTTNQLPTHTHPANCLSTAGDSQQQRSPKGAVWAAESQGVTTVYDANAPDTTMDPRAIGTAGSSQPHANVQPYTCVNFIIALQGVFPTRS